MTEEQLQKAQVVQDHFAPVLPDGSRNFWGGLVLIVGDEVKALDLVDKSGGDVQMAFLGECVKEVLEDNAV